MVRGGVERSETEGIRKSDFDKVNRNADINPQKGRHLLCSFCPCKNGNKVKRAATPRERKETGSQPHCGAPPVSVLYKSFRRHSLNFFRKNLTKRRCEGRWCEAPEGIRSSAAKHTIPQSVLLTASSLCTREPSCGRSGAPSVPVKSGAGFPQVFIFHP